MDISLFKTFVTVAKYRSISIASDVVHLTQPAVTKQIKLLEEQYGNRLFERGGKQLKITREGTILLEYANQILATYSQSLEAMIESADQVRGNLRFGSNLTLGIYILPKLVRLFSDSYPSVNFEIFLGNSEQITKAIRQKELSFGFISTEAVEETSVVHHVFYGDRVIVVVGKDSGPNGRIMGWNELEQLPFIGRERGSDIRETTERWLKERSIKLKPRMELNNTEAIKQCIQAGLGFSILPWCTVEEEIRLGQLCEVKAPYFEPVQEFYISHYEGSKFSRLEKVFLEFLFHTIESRSLSTSLSRILPPQLKKLSR